MEIIKCSNTCLNAYIYLKLSTSFNASTVFSVENLSFSHFILSGLNIMEILLLHLLEVQIRLKLHLQILLIRYDLSEPIKSTIMIKNIKKI